MSSAEPISGVAYIGETAGAVWKVLTENGPVTTTKLVQAVGAPRDTVMQAVGWLAREDKIDIADRGRSRVVSLR